MFTPTQVILRYFDFTHLPAGPAQDTSRLVRDLAIDMARSLPPGPETDAGMRHLLEAKDAFVRAALDLE